MKKTFFILSLLLVGILTSACFSLLSRSQEKETPVMESTCPPLPDNFSESDLIGTWSTEYFGGLATDQIILREDGLFKQVYSSQPRNFESDWQKWWMEYDSNGYALLHLEGMRRCDDIESICNNPGGGLPNGELAINQCTQKYLHYENEVILLVTGYAKTTPRGIVLRQARLAGSDWTYLFRLNKSATP